MSIVRYHLINGRMADVLDGRWCKFDDVQSELAALREELDGINEIYMDGLNERLDLIQRLTAAEQRNAELVELLRTHTNHVATLCDVMFRFGIGMYKEPEQKIYSALAQQQVVFAALKPTESGASE